MVTVSTRMLTMTVAIAGVFAAGSAPAQVQTERAIEQYSCKDVMRDPGPHREIAIAFLHGFMLGKSGESKFNIAALEKQTDAFIERCLDNPQEKAEDAMAKVKK